MAAENYQTRLKSFRSGELTSKGLKWTHKVPSMASLARSFYIFYPEPGLKDQVSCVKCGYNLANWSKFRGNPIERHAHSNNDCFVSKLGALCTSISQGNSVNFKSLATACLASFDKGRESNDISRELASQGFIYMASDETHTDTVGCISCLCFPQNARDNPKHSQKCPISKLTRNCSPEEVSDFLECRSSSQSSATPQSHEDNEICIDTKQLIPGKCGIVPLEPISPSDDKVTKVSIKNVEEPLKQAVDYLLLNYPEEGKHSHLKQGIAASFELFNGANKSVPEAIRRYAAKYEAEEADKVTILDQLEEYIITALEKLHARRINLLYSEVENTILRMIADSA